MTETKLYLIRHGKTMFNTIDRVQGWSDTPLTPEGREVIQHLGAGLQSVPFEEAYSSDSGRAIQTAKIILQQHQEKENIPYEMDERIREWGFGSLDGGYNNILWELLARLLNVDSLADMSKVSVSYKELADAILAADTTGWAEPYEQIRERVWTGFEDIARNRERNNGGNALVVSHGYTIAFFLSLIDTSRPIQFDLINGSVTTVCYNNGKFTIDTVNDTNYIETGKQHFLQHH
ncbi:histidine phosphatase family protein [Enterococcus sp. BWR-S5]|uniref:histidine phosphatase family protein n=1 Tax=Enterococcus sp. BWR-S5 TaxID=2787714 RepID=UPI0019231940|nr:histidine phosphatase family protein [Enterococcus sp. BWR-S5]MBL1226957.1 histidine phosphatase family protein [Enterococcus sp. BWR-S5]